jgi:hypothetical protein
VAALGYDLLSVEDFALTLLEEEKFVFWHVVVLVGDVLTMMTHSNVSLHLNCCY